MADFVGDERMEMFAELARRALQERLHPVRRWTPTRRERMRETMSADMAN
jgi:hypothetical protein